VNRHGVLEGDCYLGQGNAMVEKTFILEEYLYRFGDVSLYLSSRRVLECSVEGNGSGVSPSDIMSLIYISNSCH
jgi:hypothetical protein